MKRDVYRDKYTKPKRKEATTVEYQLEVEKRKKQSRSEPEKGFKKAISKYQSNQIQMK